MTPKLFTTTFLVKMPESGEWVVWDDDQFFKFDQDTWDDINKSYSKIGFDSYEMLALDGTKMLVLTSAKYGVRVYTTRA